MARRLALALALTGLLCALTLLISAGTGLPVVEAQPLAGAFTTCAAQAQIPEIECLALTALYTSTNGFNWTNHTDWLETDEPCNWFGVSCDYDHVVGLFLDGNQLSGSLPTNLGDLTFLENLSMQGNQLTGSLPSQMGNLSALRDLDLSANQLSGSIPAELGNLSAIESIYLSDNQLSGSIPASLGNLSNLVTLDLYNNALTGSVPAALGNLSSLHMLHLAGNQLSGAIPAELGNLSNLESLYLPDNQLTGSIPAALGNLTKLKNLEVHGNQLTGSIPPELGNLSALEWLQLGHNQLTGGIPAALGNLSNLQSFHLGYNQLSGSIPASLGNLSNLVEFALAGNQLTGAIPAELGNLGNVSFFDVHSNALAGDIPASLTNLTNVGNPDFGYNMLIASDPDLLDFLSARAPGWYLTQTVPPADVLATPFLSSSIQLTWMPISYRQDGGYYEISYATTAGGPYTVHGVTADKDAEGYLVDGLSPNTPYYFVVRTFTPARESNWQQNALWSGYSAEATATTPPSGPYLRRVNCGGSDYTDTKGNLWTADREFTLGGWGYFGGYTSTTLNPIANTADAPLYQSDRIWYNSARPGYQFTVPNGAYEVTLKFAETAMESAGQRKFTVRIEGVQVVTRYDIFAIAGAKDKAVADRTFVVNVADGELNIELLAVLYHPKINAIQVKQLTTYELRVNCGGSLYKDGAGRNWRSDKVYGPGGWGYTGGFIRTTTAAIAGTLNDPLYQSERQWSGSAAPGYRFSVPNGTYDVTLRFAETAYNEAGKRVFSIKLEGVTKLSNYDIFAAAGAKNMAAPDRTFSVVVTDGVLTVDFIQIVGTPKVNAIRIKRTGD